MKPEKLTIYEIFEKQRRYVVPLFQRPYVWTKDGQWQALWEDISEKARTVEQHTARAPHFLGAIVTSQRPVFGKEMNAWEIIDGQQRLTTLQIVLAALRDYAVGADYGAFVTDLQRLTRNDGVMKDTIERYKVWPTNSDQAAFEAVMSSGGLTGVAARFPALKGKKLRRGHPFADAYLFFHSAIDRYVTAPDEDGLEASRGEERFGALFETFRRYLQLVTIELETDDDPQVIFESLNARGVPLLASDLIRNYVFLRASRRGATLADLYDQYWRDYDERTESADEPDVRFWKVEERQGRFRRPRLDLFMFHYLQYRLEQEVNIGHLFQEFRTWWEREKHDEDVVAALGQMKHFSKEFSNWMAPSASGRVGLFAHRLRTLDTSTVFPLMLLVLVESAADVTPSDREGILDDLESYLVRRAVCGLTTKNYNVFFLGVVRGLRKTGVTRQSVRDLLAAGKGDSVRWPDDEEFGRALLHRPVYRVVRQGVVSMILAALDQSLMTSKQERVHLVGKLSIEHVMPQSWKEPDWPAPPGGAEGVARREILIDTLGNLTLLTGALNSSVSNAGFPEKKGKYFSQSLLFLNKYFGDTTDWNEAAILARSMKMLESLRQVWPHPRSTEPLDALALDERSDAMSADTPPDEDDALPPITLSAARLLLDEVARVRAR